jgi:hypothetical protein
MRISYNKIIRNVLFIACLHVLIILLHPFIHAISEFYVEHLQFLFLDSLKQFKFYYPRYYLPIFITTRAIKYSSILLFPLLAYSALKTINRKSRNLTKHFRDIKNWKVYIAVIAISTLASSLIFYYYFPQKYTLDIEFNLFISRVFISLNVFYWILLFLLNLEYCLGKIRDFFSEPVLPYSLALTRILFFGYSIFLYLIIYPLGKGDFTGLSKETLPFLTWLIKLTPVSNELYLLFCVAGAITSLMIVVGYKTRLFLIINSFIVFYVVATPNFFGKLWHEQIVIWIAWILASSPCYDVFSIDSKINPRQTQKKAAYGFHLKMIWLHFGLIYFFAGFHKLWVSGFDWALSQSMINQIHLEWFENYNKIPPFRIDLYPSLLHVSGLIVILFELSFIFFLFNRKTKWLSVIGGLTMHNIIGLLMYISFSFLLQAFYLVFIPWNSILTKLNLLKKQWTIANSSLSIKKLSILIPVIIFFMNFWYGVFRISSYPFSVYPTYTDIVPSSFQYLEFNFLDKTLENIDLWEEAKKNNFRWESFSRFETVIVKDYREKQIIDTLAIKQQWNRWANGVPLLRNIDSVEVYGVEILLAPEYQRDTLYKEYFTTIYP